MCQTGWIVIARDPIGPQDATPGATVNDGPLAIGANPDGNGFHLPAASTLTISWGVVDVAAPQAEWAVIAVFSA